MNNINITTSNNTVSGTTTTLATTGTGTLTVSPSANPSLYTLGSINTINYQPYSYATSFSFPYLTMMNRAHIKQLRIIKRILRQNKVYASAGNAHR
jgi:hypothetical protein